MKITLLDYGACNVASVERALQRLGAESQRAAAPECIANAEAIVLPGVGHFETLMRALDDRGLRGPLLDALARGVPFLGICLGLQALYLESDEAPELSGLQLLPARVRSHVGRPDDRQPFFELTIMKREARAVPRPKDQGGYGLTLPDLIVCLLGVFLLESPIRKVQMRALIAVTCGLQFFSI